MEESAQSREKSKWYVLLGLVGLVIFGLSIYAGYRIGGEAGVTPAHKTEETSISKYDPPLVTPTIATPRPVTLEIKSELEGIKLVDKVDTTVLAEWWKIIGVDSEALPLKELGGYNWYTPTRLRIVFRDITPLSKDERWKLYKPTASSREAEPIAGLATVYDAVQPDILEYQAYHDAQVLTGDKAVEAIEKSVNRRVFEVLYEGAIGSTAMTRDDYRRKRDEIFENWQGQGVVELRDEEPQTYNGTSYIHEILSVEDSLQDDIWEQFGSSFIEEGILSVVDSLQDDMWGRLVGQAYAQTCGGNWKCGANWEECKCSVSQASCLESQEGDSCGPGYGTCNCTKPPLCVQETGALNSCSAAYGVCGPSSSCSQCVAVNTCGWSGGGTTPTAGPTPTSGSGGGHDNCIVRGKIQKYDDLNLASANGVVSLWSSLATNTDSTDGSGNFGFSKSYDNVGPTIKVYVNNPYSPYRTFKVKDMPSGCSKEDNSAGTDTVTSYLTQNQVK